MKKAPATKSMPRRPEGKSRGGMLLGLFVGLVIGVVIAFGVVWYLNRTPLPFQDKFGRAERQAEKPAPAASAPEKAAEPLPGKPGDKAGEKPRFEFYKILPGGQEATPAAPAAAPVAAAAPAEVPAASSDLFYLQAGAFQKMEEADNLKAKLALLGVEVGVQEVAIPDKGTMFRVRVGPYGKPEEMNRARNQLAQNGIQTSVVKVKDSGKN